MPFAHAILTTVSGEKFSVIPQTSDLAADKLTPEQKAPEPKLASIVSAVTAGEFTITVESLRVEGRQASGIGVRIRALRERKGFGLNATARTAKIRAATLCDIEKKGVQPQVETFHRILEILSLPHLPSSKAQPLLTPSE